MSLAVPLTNSLTFIFTGAVGWFMGEKINNGRCRNEDNHNIFCHKHMHFGGGGFMY